MYPCIEIKLDGIIHNLNILKNECASRKISLALVTKVLGGNSQLVNEIITKAQVDAICDSRVQNLKQFKNIKVEKWLIRSPMISEADEVVKYSDVSLNSEAKVLEALNASALAQNKVHKVILMYECGDLREGCYEAELQELASKCNSLAGIELYGIGTNLSCLNEVLPTTENMKSFTDAVNALEEKLSLKIPVVSGGASSSIELLFSGELDEKINNLRMGEAVYLGNIPVYDKPFENAKTDNFILNAEIIEVKKKPASPEILYDENNLRTRAIVAVGKQDIYLPGLLAIDERIKIVGGSSDHVILDITECTNEYKIGDVVKFKMNYNCLLNAMTSPYIEKKIL